MDFMYSGSDQWILKDFCSKVQEREGIVFVGESGTGKSTLLNILIGFIQSQNGKILIDCFNMVNLNMIEYRSQIAFVPQNRQLFRERLKIILFMV